MHASTSRRRQIRLALLAALLAPACSSPMPEATGSTAEGVMKPRKPPVCTVDSEDPRCTGGGRGGTPQPDFFNIVPFYSKKGISIGFGTGSYITARYVVTLASSGEQLMFIEDGPSFTHLHEFPLNRVKCEPFTYELSEYLGTSVVTGAFDVRPMRGMTSTYDPITLRTTISFTTASPIATTATVSGIPTWTTILASASEPSQTTSHHLVLDMSRVPESLRTASSWRLTQKVTPLMSDCEP